MSKQNVKRRTHFQLPLFLNKHQGSKKRWPPFFTSSFFYKAKKNHDHFCSPFYEDMLCSKRLSDHDLMYALWRQGKHISNLIRVFCKFSCRVILSRSSFIQTSIFHKNFFLVIFNTVYFLIIPFYSRQNIFFYHFQKYFFFEENE